MTELEMATVVLAGVNTLLALALGAVYVRNHAEIKSPFTLGLLAFAAFLVLHNSMVLYHWFTMMNTGGFDPPLVLLENILQLGALAALLSATFR